MPPYRHEVEVLEKLGIPSWNHLSKGSLMRLLDELPQVDPQLALALLAQIPEISQLAQVVIADAAAASDAAVAANAVGQTQVHHIHRERLRILEAELQKDLSPEQWLRVLDDMREVDLHAQQQHAKNQAFISEQHEKRWLAGLTVAAGVCAAVYAAARSGAVPQPGVNRILKAAAELPESGS